MNLASFSINAKVHFSKVFTHSLHIQNTFLALFVWISEFCISINWIFDFSYSISALSIIKSGKSGVMAIASLDPLHLVALNILQQIRRHWRGIDNSLLL